MKGLIFLILSSLALNALAFNHPTCELRLESYLAADGKYKKLDRIPEEYKQELKHLLREKGYVIVENHEIFDEASMLLLSYGSGIPISESGEFKCFMEFNLTQGEKTLKQSRLVSGQQFILKKYACTEVFKSMQKKIPSCIKG